MLRVAAGVCALLGNRLLLWDWEVLFPDVLALVGNRKLATLLVCQLQLASGDLSQSLGHHLGWRTSCTRGGFGQLARLRVLSHHHSRVMVPRAVLA